MYVDDIKLFAKNEKGLETLIYTVRIYSRDIGMEFGVKKWQTTSNWWNGTTKSR